MTDLTRREFAGRMTAAALLSAGAVLSASQPGVSQEPGKIFRLGIVGLDTSHVTEFTKQFNRQDGKSPRLAGFRVTAAFPAGNRDFPLSKNRIAGFTKDVRDLGVRIVDSLEELMQLVDGVLLESVDGTQHLQQALPILAARKPLFIDKPLAASLKDVLQIAEAGKKLDVPWFTASSSRFTAGYPELRKNEQVGKILGCDTYSQARAAPGHPDLFWYGVHGIDLLYSLLGTGCESVTAVQTPYSEQVTGTWKDGRIGTYRAIREHTGKTGLGATVFGTQGIAHVNNYYDYVPFVAAIADFFRNQRSPVAVDEMVEVFAYMTAAEESKRRKGAPVLLQEIVAQAQNNSP